MCEPCAHAAVCELVVVCALVTQGGEVLVAQRPTGKEDAGKWEVPGGKVEVGETFEHCAVLEDGATGKLGTSSYFL